MTSSDWAAWIGAAAWLYPIGQLAFNVFAKPKIELISSSNVEIGYSSFGPVVNVTASISTQRRDALIKYILLTATHEKGETRSFLWAYLKEYFSEVQAGPGEFMEFSKRQPAIAMKVTTQTLAEKVITFFDREHDARSNAYLREVTDLYRHLKEHNEAPQDALMQSRELIKHKEFFENNMYWREGSYKFDFVIFMVGVKRPHTQSFTVTFNKTDIDALRKNLNNFEPFILSMTVGNQPPFQWSWANVGIRPVN